MTTETTNDGGDDPFQHITAGGTAVAVLEKYRGLNQEIENVYQETQSIKRKIEGVQERIGSCRKEKCRMEKEFLLHKQETDKLLEKASEKEQDKECSRLLQSAMRERDQAQQHLDFVQRYAAQHRQDFLEHSRSFRRECQRVRLEAVELGMPQTFLNVNGIYGTDDEEGGNDSDDDPESNNDRMLKRKLHKIALEYGVGQKPMIGQPTNNDDEEMCEALQAYCDAFQVLQQTNEGWNELQEKHHGVEETSCKRAGQLQQLQLQLERIRGECRTLDQERKSLQEQAQETEALTQSFRQRAQQKQRRAVRNNNNNNNARTGRTSNPYATKRNTTPGGLISIKPTMNIETALQRQHPHLAGRIRHDRRFDSGLGIIGGAELAPPGHNSTGTETSGTARRPTRRSLAEDDSDSDDDVINSFSAFGNNS